MTDKWQDGATVPELKRGQSEQFIVAVRRARSGRVHTFAASYLNAYPLIYNDHCPKGDGCAGEGCDDGCPTTGWFELTGNDDEAGTYWPLSLDNGDQLVGWCERPRWPT